MLSLVNYTLTLLENEDKFFNNTVNQSELITFPKNHDPARIPALHPAKVYLF